jgi:hypothetical protein
LHSRSALTDAKFGKELRQYRLYRQRDSTLKVVDLFQFREENVKAGRGWALTVDIAVRRCAAFTNVVADVKLRLHCRGSLLGLSRISPKHQHEALVGQAKLAIGTWDFPYHAAVRDLVNAIAERCKEKTLLGNAPLDDGANAIGIPQDEMDRVLARSERLTRILHFAFAYKALVFVPQYSCKNRMWCLLELGALPCMAHGLTLRRGGFIEDTLAGVQSMVGG